MNAQIYRPWQTQKISKVTLCCTGYKSGVYIHVICW